MTDDAEQLRPLDYNPDEALLVRLAWACEVEGLTQAEAAQQFGLTRLRVNQVLAEARRRGVVRVQLQSSYSACASLERELADAWRLACVRVAPRVRNMKRDGKSVNRQVGAALGCHLSTLLPDRKLKRIGITWGNTISMALRYLTPIKRTDLTVVSAMGGLSIGNDQNVVETTRTLARLCSAKKSYFTAPLYADSAESRKIIEAQGVFKRMIEGIRQVDTLITALGDTSTSSMLIREGLPDNTAVDALIKTGAVGDVLGYFVNPEGHPVAHPINDRVIGITLDDAQHISNVILAAGGNHKVPGLRATLARGLVDTLVTDENTARQLLP